MTKKELQKRILKTKALQGKTIADIIRTDKFRENISVYLDSQRKDRAKMKEVYARSGRRAPAHVIDRLDFLNAENYGGYCIEVMEHCSKLSTSQRIYILQLGRQALIKTEIDYIVAEQPKLAAEIEKLYRNERDS